MKKTILLSITVAGLMAAASCATGKKTATIGDLTGEWEVINISGVDVTNNGGEAPYIGFDTANGTINGYTGCNRIMGTFDNKADNGVIDLSAIGSTRMMCPDMKQETDFLNALSSAKGYELNKTDNLVLTSENGKALITLKKRADNFGINALTGNWKIIELADSVMAENSGNNYSIKFDGKDSTFVAMTGCNNIAGNFNASYTAITLTNLMQTEMACPDMYVEESLMRILPELSSFGRLASGNLGFYDKHNNLLLILQKQP